MQPCPHGHVTRCDIKFKQCMKGKLYVTFSESLWHLAESAKMLSTSDADSFSDGHWLISITLKSISMPLVPLEIQSERDKGYILKQCRRDVSQVAHFFISTNSVSSDVPYRYVTSCVTENSVETRIYDQAWYTTRIKSVTEN